MPSIGSYGSHEYDKHRRVLRATYAQKLRKMGIHENGSKWRTLMHRKGL